MIRRDSKRSRDSVDSVDDVPPGNSPERGPDDDPGIDSRTRRRVREAKCKARPG